MQERFLRNMRVTPALNYVVHNVDNIYIFH